MNCKYTQISETLIIGLLGILLGTLIAFDSRTSDSSFIFICLLIFIAYGIFTFGMLVIRPEKKLILQPIQYEKL